MSITNHSWGVPYHSWRITVRFPCTVAIGQWLIYRLIARQAPRSDLALDWRPGLRPQDPQGTRSPPSQRREGEPRGNESFDRHPGRAQGSPRRFSHRLSPVSRCPTRTFSGNTITRVGFANVLIQFFGWPMYLIRNATGQKSYPRFTNREGTHLTSLNEANHGLPSRLHALPPSLRASSIQGHRHL